MVRPLPKRRRSSSKTSGESRHEKDMDCDSLQKHKDNSSGIDLHKCLFRVYLVISFSEPIGSNLIICVAINSLVADKAFSMPSAPATLALNTANTLLKWIPTNCHEVELFQTQLRDLLSSCIVPVASSSSADAKMRSKMWSKYQSVRTSPLYLNAWKAFLRKCSQLEMSHMFCQYIGHRFFLHLIKSQCNFAAHDINSKMPIDLTDEENQALCYAAGYIPRSLKKKILKSSRPHQQILDDLLSDGTEESVSTEWITAVNRGGLFVNNMTFELFYSMELEFRRFVGTDGINSCAVERMEKNDDNILFCWCIVSAAWDEECSSVLLPMILR